VRSGPEGPPCENGNTDKRRPLQGRRFLFGIVNFAMNKSELLRLPADTAVRYFAEPWQAQALAVTLLR
jgi:hypothetical protein